jgi:hypothetical protein
MVYELITGLFLDMCLFIVLSVKCWNDKNHLILSSIEQDLCFDYIFFVFTSPDVEHFKVWSFCCSCPEDKEKFCWLLLSDKLKYVSHKGSLIGKAAGFFHF